MWVSGTSATKERSVQPAALHYVYSLQGCKVVYVCCVHAQQNYVVAVGAEGWFHLFDLTSAASNKADSSSQHEFTLSEDQKPLFTQHIPANTKVILISDIGKAWCCTLTHQSLLLELFAAFCACVW